MQCRRRWMFACALAWAVGLASSAQAVPIATWDIANATGQSAAVGFTETGVSAVDLVSVGVPLWPNTNQDGFVVASDWAPGAVADPSRYFEWSLTIDASTEIDLNSIDLALFRGLQGPNHGAELWDLHASFDGFSGSDISLATLDISASAGDEQTLFNVDLSTLGTLMNTTVTFRLYGYDYTSNNDYSGLGNDSGWVIGGTGADVMIDGVLVPEPSVALMVGVGLLLLGSFARSSRTAQSSAKRSR
ncbi:MAG: hypothetical protein OEP95_04185 [Myxococcales bacterium]|nr:hypothetical protein [Myxococcales bacterium]